MLNSVVIVELFSCIDALVVNIVNILIFVLLSDCGFCYNTFLQLKTLIGTLIVD